MPSPAGQQRAAPPPPHNLLQDNSRSFAQAAAPPAAALQGLPQLHPGSHGADEGSCEDCNCCSVETQAQARWQKMMSTRAALISTGLWLFLWLLMAFLDLWTAFLELLLMACCVSTHLW